MRWGARAATPEVLESVASARHLALPSFEPRSLASLIGPFLHCKEPLGEASHALVAAVARDVARRSAGLEAPNLVRFARAYADAVGSGRIEPQPDLFRALASAAAGRLGRFTERELSLLPWAICRASAWETTQPLLEAIAEESAERLHEFKPGGLVCLAWSYSRAVTRRDGGDARGSKSGGGGRGSRSRSGAVDEGAWPASVTLLDLLAEEVCARGNELSRSEIRSIEMSYAHLRRPNPFSVSGDHLHGTPLDVDDAQEGETLY